jgi:hypothetical protein
MWWKIYIKMWHIAIQIIVFWISSSILDKIVWFIIIYYYIKLNCQNAQTLYFMFILIHQNIFALIQYITIMNFCMLFKDNKIKDMENKHHKSTKKWKKYLEIHYLWGILIKMM